MTEPCTPSQFWEPDYDETAHLRGLLARRTEIVARLIAEKAEMQERIDHFERTVGPLTAVGREVQKRVNAYTVEGSYVDLPGIKIPPLRDDA